MTDAAERILKEAMKLPPEARSRIAQQLLDSVAANDDMDPEARADVPKAIAESEQDIDAGRVVDEAEMWAKLRTIR